MSLTSREATPGERTLQVALRGVALISDPILNKGTNFSDEERAAFGLEGLLPPAHSTLAQQVARSYANYLRSGDDLGRYLYLAALQERNATLFYRLLVDHMEEMAPVFYTPTVGQVCEQFSRIYHKPKGLFVSSKHRGRIARVLANAPRRDYRVLVVTDNEAILGLGDLGAGGMGIAIGKLALYTAGAGVHPASCLPVDLDVGTDREELLADPLYLGVRHRRLRGEEYWSLVDEFVEAVGGHFPQALVQWEDFASQNAFRVLERYRDRVLSFNDDIQGTAAVVVAGIRCALGHVGRRLLDERIVFYGAGASGAGCALGVRTALARAGVPAAELSRHVLCLDSQGLVLADRPRLEHPKTALAADPALVAGWTSARPGRFDLGDVVRHYRPTVLVGSSGQPGAFTEEMVRLMLERCDRPIFLPISNPNSKAEATPADLLRWSNGAAVVGTGSPFDPVEWGGVTYRIGQGNNVLVFPGVGLGAIAVRARALPDEAFLAAADALVRHAPPCDGPGAPIYPPLRRLREVCFEVAVAVARTLVAAGAAPPMGDAEVEAAVRATVWEPEYARYVPV